MIGLGLGMTTRRLTQSSEVVRPANDVQFAASDSDLVAREVRVFREIPSLFIQV